MSVSPDQSTVLATPLPANHVQLAPGAVAKIRNPILVVVFSIITLGIYQVFWWYYANRETRRLRPGPGDERARGQPDEVDARTLSREL